MMNKYKRKYLEFCLKYKTQIDFLGGCYYTVIRNLHPHELVRKVKVAKIAIQLACMAPKLYEFDYSSIFMLLKFQMERLNDSARMDRFHDLEDPVKALTLCEDLLSRIEGSDDYYYDTLLQNLLFDKLGYRKEFIYNKGLFETYIDEEKECISSRYKEAGGWMLAAGKLWENPSNLSSQEVTKLEQQAYQYIDKFKKAEVKVLFHIMSNNILKWWW